MSGFPAPDDTMPPEVVFLHIGKTGGTALRVICEADALDRGRPRLVMLGHDSTLRDAAARWPRAGLGFFIRDPVERLVSGFLSRQRQGMPRYKSPWTDGEREAFSRFATPTARGEALARGEPAARAACAAISHVRRGLALHLHDVPTLEALRDRIVFIGGTEEFEADVSRLRTLFGVTPRAILPTDDVAAHRGPADAPRELSAAAREAFRALVHADYEILAWCLEHRRVLAPRVP